MTESIIFPWNDVDVCRRDKTLQANHSVAVAKSKFRDYVSPCPTCSKPAEKLTWVYFVTPALGGSRLAGRAGWLTLCGKCDSQVSFFRESSDELAMTPI